jgi:hypothetical protein
MPARYRFQNEASSRYFAAVHESGCVKVFGRLHDDPARARRRQAYEKHQWTESREPARVRCDELYQGLIETPTLMVRDGTSRDEVDGAFKRLMRRRLRGSGRRTQPERAGTDLE